MKRLIITEEERSRILGMHQNAIRKEFLNENLILEQLSQVNVAELTITPEEKQDIDNDPGSLDRLQKTLQIFRDNGIVFSIDQTTAAYIFVNNSGLGNVVPKFVRDIKVMDSPTNPEKVLTTGFVSETGITEPNNPSAESNYLDIAKYANNFALYSMINYGQEGGGVVLNVNTVSGTLTAKELNNDQIWFYGTVKTTAAQSKQEVVTTTWTIPETGSDIVKNIPGTSFETGKMNLKDSTELDKAIVELTSLVNEKNTKIASIVIESSASGDRPVGGKSGYPNDKADIAKYPIGKPYTPKNANESGNAALAFGRGETVKAKLGNLGPVTIKPMIQTGGDAAQYAKLIVSIRKVDKPEQPMSKSELQNILLKKASTENLQGNKIFRLFMVRAK